MSTIAYRDGQMAADTGMTGSNGSHLLHTHKIVKRADGALIGAVGDAAYAAAFLKWAVDEVGPPPDAKRLDGSTDRGVIVRAIDAPWEIYEARGMFSCFGPYFALGSGAPEATGAMHAGASAVDAVRAALAHDEGTFGEIDVLNEQQSQ